MTAATRQTDGPSPWIERFGHLVPADGAVLDVAAGAGRHARWFLHRGHPVTAVDRDTAALTDLSGAAGLRVVTADLEAGEPWPFASRSFAAVVVVNYLHRPLLPDLVATVAASGVLLYDTFGVGNEAFGRPTNPDFLLRPGELLQAVEGALQVVAYEHGIVPGAAPRVRQRICARRAKRPAAIG